MPCCNAGNARRLSPSWCPDTTYKERERARLRYKDGEGKRQGGRWRETKKGRMRQCGSEVEENQRERDGHVYFIHFISTRGLA